MKRFKFYIFVISLSIISSCATKSGNNLPRSRDLEKAEQLMQRGKSKQAVYYYQRLADQKSPHRNRYRLLLIDSLIKSGKTQEAMTHVNTINKRQLSPRERDRLKFLQVQISLSSGDTEKALAFLNEVPVQSLKYPDQVTYFQSKAFAYSLAGDLLASTNERIKLAQIIQDPQVEYENNVAIMETLSLLPSHVLKSSRQQGSEALNGWVALTSILKLRNSPDLNAALNEWYQMYPQHSVTNSAFIETYLESSRHDFQRPGSIAILLPESGALVGAAQAVREGFMAAYYNQGDDAIKPNIQFYNSAASNIVALYQQAVEEGAELIIGPLNKEKIKTLISTVDLKTPVLALNHIPGVHHPMLYQFGLSPIDEAGQIARKAWADGHRRMLVLTSNSNYGQRISQYFTKIWQEMGGKMLEAQSYNPKETDYSKSIKTLLNLDESQQRFKQISNVIPRAKFTARRRSDVDAIFISGYPRAARLINPQLKFYRAKQLPVYATSRLYIGRPNPGQDSDLNGIRFCDIPWLLNAEYDGELSLSALQNAWQQIPTIYLRLIALGIDSYNIVAHLDKMDGNQYHGATGNLLLTGGNRIKRQLMCAKFVEGKPQQAQFVESAEINYESITEVTEQSESVPVDVER
jgi:outer membrane PBP1 activator LpoA protein